MPPGTPGHPGSPSSPDTVPCGPGLVIHRLVGEGSWPDFITSTTEWVLLADLDGSG